MGRSSKKKFYEQASQTGSIVDPLANLSVGFECYDINRVASVYADNTGERWWTKAWFNNKEKGEPAQEITKKLAIAFIHDEIKKDDWLSRFYPKMMTSIINSLEKTRQQLLGV